MSDPTPDVPVRPFSPDGEDYRWTDVDLQIYKDTGDAPFRSITRQTLFRRDDLRGELRYFEIAARGHSTLERHQHSHAVVVLRGDGEVLVGDAVYAIKPFDLVVIPSLTWHQFRAEDGPLGFLCMVDRERDKPQIPGPDEIETLRRTPRVAAFLDATRK